MTDIELLLLNNNTRPLWGASTHYLKTKEGRDFMSKVHKGKKCSDETRAKMSLASKKKRHTPETRDKIRAANKGKIVSEETRAKISASLKGRPARNKNIGKPFMTPNGLFPSRAAAARSLNKTFDYFTGLMKKFPKEYYYV
jgi:hypothetical protein